MRAIFVVLLIANVAFFAHQYFYVKDTNLQIGKPSQHVEAKSNLQLLAEANSSSPNKQRLTPVSAAVPDSSPAGEKAELCTMIGPYDQLLQAEYAVERLNALGVIAHITPVEIQEGEIFWVHLKPEMSEKEAVRRLYELQKKNIESHVITKGDLANGISFGRFADYQQAESKMQEVESQGYEAVIKRLPKTIHETWVVLDAGFAEKVGISIWDDLLSKQSGLERRQNVCLGVASQ